MIRRLVAAAALLAAVLPAAAALAPPAGAHPEGWSTSGWGVAPEHVFAEVPVIGFTFVHDGPVTQPGVERATYSVAPAGEVTLPRGCDLPPAGEVQAPPDRTDTETLSAAVSLPIPCNGRYVMTATGFTGANRLNPEPESHSMTLTFGVSLPAPPPTNVEVALADLDGNRAVRVSWMPPEPLPPDLVGYEIARSRSADDGFEVVGTSVEPEFVDGDAAEGGRFHYRVHSVRLGAGTEPVRSEPTPAASVQVPAPASPTTTGGSPPSSAVRPSGDLAGFGSLQQQADRLRPPPQPGSTVSPGPVTTVDTGFQPTLPFDPNAPVSTTTIPPGAPAGDLAAGGSSQIFEGDSPSDRKAVLGPVAGAAALLMVFLQLRWLLRQASSTP